MSHRITRIVLIGFCLVLLASAATAAGTSRVIWITRSDNGSSEYPSDAELSPDGSRLFVTGDVEDTARTIAYDAATGKRLWARAPATAIAINPAGTRVLVTRESPLPNLFCCYQTYAYSASSGALRWHQSYQSPYGLDSFPGAITATRKRVFVTGSSWTNQGPEPDSVSPNYDMATVAYASGTGRQLWVRRYRGPGKGADGGNVLLTTNDGSILYVVGTSWGGDTRVDYVVVAYRARTGKQLWESRYDGPLHLRDTTSAAVLTPDGSTIIVAGSVNQLEEDPGSEMKWATVAFDARTGARRWARVHDGPASSSVDYVSGSAASPDSRTVYVTGSSEVVFGSGQGGDLTIAYDTATGKTRWKTRFGHFFDGGVGVVVSPDSRVVYVTGADFQHDVGSYNPDYGTRAYRASDGTMLWQSRYSGPGNDWDAPIGILMSPDGARLYVPGLSFNRQDNADYATVALRAR